MQLIENLFANKGRVKILKKLAQHKGWWFNVTELSRDMDTNKGAISKIVGALEKENLIIVNKKGKIKLFRLNEQNVLVSEILLRVLKMEEEFFKNIKERITNSFSDTLASSIILYGSYAKGVERLESDVDVMVAVKNKPVETRCKNVAEGLSQEFLDKGLLLRIDIIGESEFKKLYLQKEPSIVSIAETGVVLSGKSIAEMIK